MDILVVSHACHAGDLRLICDASRRDPELASPGVPFVLVARRSQHSALPSIEIASTSN